ncbi:MAG: hypothetical protein RLZZ436_612 [Planctomycetota bacterium]|jgi:hypothetical protein
MTPFAAALFVALCHGLSLFDEPAKPEQPATTADKSATAQPADAQPLPDGLARFNGMLVGRLTQRDVETGSFVVEVDAISRVWENSRAENPKALVGRRVRISGVFGKFLDVLVVTRIGETLEFECRHDGEKLVFPGELLRKVAPYAPEDYPVLPEDFRGFRGVVQAEVLKKDAESQELIVRIERVVRSIEGNAARNADSIEGKNLLLAGFWNRRELFASIKPGDRLETGLHHISRRSDHVSVADPVRRLESGQSGASPAGGRRMSEEKEKMREEGEPTASGSPGVSAGLPQQQRGFRGMLVGRLIDKDVERGTFTVEVDAVPRVWKNSRASEPRTLRGSKVAAGGVTGKLLDVLLLCKVGETLEFGARDDGGAQLTVVESLRKVSPVKPGDYPELPDGFRGFRGMLQGRVVRKDPEMLELTVEVTRVGELFGENRAEQPQTIIGQKVMLAGFWQRREAFQNAAVDAVIEFGAEHPQRQTDHLTVIESVRIVEQ